MSALTPPVLATWLLELMDSTAWKGAVIGDLFEEYQLRRSPAWYWRQVLPIVAIAVVKDLRHHWVLAFRALAVAFLFASLSNDLVRGTGFIGLILRIATELLGRQPSLFIAAALEPFLICAPAGLAVALTHRKCPATMVLWYTAALLVIIGWPRVNYGHGILNFILYCECTMTALTGALFGGFLGIAWGHTPYRQPNWASQQQ